MTWVQSRHYRPWRCAFSCGMHACSDDHTHDSTASRLGQYTGCHHFDCDHSRMLGGSLLQPPTHGHCHPGIKVEDGRDLHSHAPYKSGRQSIHLELDRQVLAIQRGGPDELDRRTLRHRTLFHYVPPSTPNNRQHLIVRVSGQMSPFSTATSRFIIHSTTGTATALPHCL